MKHVAPTAHPTRLLKAPFPWFGGKRRAAEIVWSRFGYVKNYVEPFFGSGAVLLNRPTSPGTETINDLDCMVANFWRAVVAKPALVAKYADNPVNEADQHARHLWLSSQVEFRERMKTDPNHYDPKIAGWWVWGQCVWIGSGWCARQVPHLGDAGKGVNRQIPHLGDAGTGVNRQIPHLGDAGTGVNRQVPHLGDAGTGGARQAKRTDLVAYMQDLADRLRHTRVVCGDWHRVLGPSVTFRHGLTGVFLDPPYADSAQRTSKLYAQDSVTVAHAVRAWCIENGDNPKLRIALCGYEGEHAALRGWTKVPWKAAGGYGNQSDGTNDNSKREVIWFSPACLK